MGHVLGDDLGASLAEAQGEQGSDLDDGLFQDDSLIRPLLLTLLLFLLILALFIQSGLLHCEGIILLLLGSLQWILSNLVHLHDHGLDGCDDQFIRITAEQQRSCR